MALIVHNLNDGSLTRIDDTMENFRSVFCEAADCPEALEDDELFNDMVSEDGLTIFGDDIETVSVRAFFGED